MVLSNAYFSKMMLRKIQMMKWKVISQRREDHFRGVLQIHRKDFWTCLTKKRQENRICHLFEETIEN